MAGARGGQLPHDWDAEYRGSPPWDVGRPQPALAAVAGDWRGRVLDLGCGTGEHALLAASRGLDATGVDLSPRAVELARTKADERGLDVRFETQDALSLPRSLGVFDTVVDSGLLHVLPPRLRPRVPAVLRRALAEDGAYHLLACSDRVPGESGPYRLREQDLTGLFVDGLELEELREAHIEATVTPEPVAAWYARVRRARP